MRANAVIATCEEGVRAPLLGRPGAAWHGLAMGSTTTKLDRLRSFDLPRARLYARALVGGLGQAPCGAKVS